MTDPIAIGDPNATELVQIQSGQFYLVRSDDAKASRECIFQNAMITVRRALTAEFHYQLVVTRLFEEGEELLLDEEDETEQERSFLIDEALEFRIGKFEGQPTFQWRDLEDDEDDLYEFVASGVNAPTVATFELATYRAMYERKYGKSSDDVPESGLKQFVYRPGPNSENRRTHTQEHTQRIPSPPTKKDLPVIISEPATLYLWDLEAERFRLQGEVDASIVENGPRDFWLQADGPETWGSHKIAPELNPKFAARDEQLYAIRSYDEDVVMRDADEDDEDDEEAIESELAGTDEEEDEQYDHEEGNPQARAFKDSGVNKQLAVSKDRSYVENQGRIGVFKNSEDTGELQYIATINKLVAPKGKAFIPKKMMLHSQETNMILQNLETPNSLFNLDIETGKVVEEWKVHDDVTVDHIAPNTKFAQVQPERTLVGASHNALFRIDPRISGNKMVDSEYKQYVSKNAFSGMATTASGKIAVASKKGDIRLFDTVGKNAKTALPALGDAILGVDVTANGRYIIATTETYLLLIDTLIGEGRYKGQLGFDRSFPADAKPMPKRLQLKPEHVLYMGNKVSFTPARFNSTEEGTEENLIVTGNGQFVVAWDFNKVKRGILDKYHIKWYPKRVVQDDFKFGADKDIIVALEDNVLLTNKNFLKVPNRQSLSVTPTKNTFFVISCILYHRGLSLIGL
ncbi:hypothetical protein Clacol_001808 [Clathrus columnatus]|uniref:VID27 cytoplasmic protein n=1 Tax=Clathrus columnatus TaxID=1419009 RepID=A0AAV5A057_9AGAM|nr:hypothetical protein Clacol_001808 [Clathrus columnatus]